MPLVRIDLNKDASAERVRIGSQAVYGATIETANVPIDDKVQIEDPGRSSTPSPARCEMAIPELNDKGRMADIPLSPEAKITVERRGEIVLIGVNRPQVYNRFDPDAFFGLARRTTTSTTTRACGRRCSSATARTSPAASTWTPSRPWPRPASRSR